MRASIKNIHLSEQYLAYLSFCRQVKFISENEFYREIYPKARRNNHRSVDGTKNNMEELIEPCTNCYSLNDIYEKWLLTLTPEKMKSNDLLDRVLVTYTIKRALNRDEKAIEKLCSLFQDAAEAIAVKMTIKRGFKEYISDIKQEAGILLRRMISGFSPKEILEGLIQNNNLRIPKYVEKFYLYWLSEYVPEGLNKIVKNPKIASRDPFEILILINPIHIFNDTIRWKFTPKAIRQFNSFSFRPNKDTNLYTWLFGTNNNPMQGRFCQFINEGLDKYYKETNKKVIDNSTDEVECNDVSNEVRSGKDGNNKKNNEIPVGDEMSEEQVVNEYKNALMKYGISERDAGITVRKIVEGLSNTEIAKQYNLSRSSILKIRKKCDPILRKIRQQSI